MINRRRLSALTTKVDMLKINIFSSLGDRIIYLPTYVYMYSGEYTHGHITSVYVCV